jgi:hypothetical protein
MSITTAITNSFKLEVLQGIHQAADTYKIALIKASATGTYGATTTNVGTPGTGEPAGNNLGTDEVTGTGYVSSGDTLTGYSATATGSVARLDWTSPTWEDATISAIGAVIYNSTRSNKVVAVFDFGGTITSTAGLFTANMPTVADGTSLIRIA